MFGDGVATAANSVDKWVTSGNTATYQEGYKEAYYQNKNNVITPQAAKAGTVVATVKGIKSGAEITDDQVANGVITLTEDQLNNANITVTGQGYTLALDTNSDITLSKVTNAKWTTNKTNATLKGTVTKGYSVADDGKSITYTNANKTGQTIATIAGIKSGVDINDGFDKSTDTITLAKAQLGGTKVTLTDTLGKGYTLALADNVKAPVINALTTDAWSLKGTTATLTGKIKKAGYTLEADGKAIDYTAATAANKTTTLATIAGVSKLPTTSQVTALNDAADGNVISLTGEYLGKTVTVNGNNLFKFNFDETVNNTTINGSANADQLSFEGSGNTVNGGKGNDKIDFTGSSGSNTLVYTAGDGDDIVVNFNGTDKISSATALTEDNIYTKSSDTLVKIGAGSINLGISFTSKDLNIYNSKSKVDTTYSYNEDSHNWAPAAASNALLADDNFVTATPKLSELVSSAAGDTSIGDLDFNTNATGLTQKNTVIAYSGKK